MEFVIPAADFAGLLQTAHPDTGTGDSNALAQRGQLKTFFQRRLIRSISAYLAVGQLNRRLYEEAGVDPRQIFFSSHFIDEEATLAADR